MRPESLEPPPLDDPLGDCVDPPPPPDDPDEDDPEDDEPDDDEDDDPLLDGADEPDDDEVEAVRAVSTLGVATVSRGAMRV